MPQNVLAEIENFLNEREAAARWIDNCASMRLQLAANGVCTAVSRLSESHCEHGQRIVHKIFHVTEQDMRSPAVKGLIVCHVYLSR